MRKAKQIINRKFRYDDGAIREMIVWQLPESVLGSEHTYKYSFFYGKDGERIVGYDNERGKGDHKHLGEIQHPYTFIDIQQLVNDFYDDVKEARDNGK